MEERSGCLPVLARDRVSMCVCECCVTCVQNDGGWIESMSLCVIEVDVIAAMPERFLVQS